MATIDDTDAEDKALQNLLDVFPTAPLELIASAFSQANSDPELAAELISFSLNGISSKLTPEHPHRNRVSSASTADKGASDSKRGRSCCTLPLRPRPKGPCPPTLEEFFPTSPEKNAWMEPLTDRLQRNLSMQDQYDIFPEPNIQPEHSPDEFPSLEAMTRKENVGSQRTSGFLPAPSRSRSNVRSLRHASAAFGLASSARSRSCKESATKIIHVREERTNGSKQLETRDEEQSLWPSETETALLLMLGDQFNLEIETVRDVLGHCAGDVGKAFEVLSQLCHFPSMSDGALGTASNFQLVEEKDTSFSKGVGVHEEVSISEEQTNPHLAKVILESLFSKPQETNAEIPENHKHILAKRKGQDSVDTADLPEWKAITSNELDISGVEEGRGQARAPLTGVRKEINGEMSSYGDWESYERHHASAKEHWKTMQSYLKAATAAYADSNFSKAELLTEKADKYKKLSKEAKERANSFLLERKNQRNESGFTLDLQEQHVTEALQLLRLHLKSFSSIPSCQIFTVITGCPEEKKPGNLKLKHEVARYLQRKGYTWVETDPFCLQIHLKKESASAVEAEK